MDANNNRPRSRQKNVTGAGKGVQRRGSGLGTGPVGGSGSKPFGRSDENASQGRRPVSRAATRGGGSLLVVLLALFLIFGKGGGLGGLLGGDSSSGGGTAVDYGSLLDGIGGGSAGTGGTAALYDSLLPGGGAFSGSASSSGWTAASNTGSLNRSVDPAAREKFTAIRGGGEDQVTVLVYMCGTDLEARSGMATRDLQEMTNAALSDKLNLIVYTGGCSKWQNSAISSSNNQIWQVKSGGIACLQKNAGTGSMTDPATLLEFLKFGKSHFPANRYELILWDHGGGSLSGYGYDQKNPRSGSMSLAALESALRDSGMQFDFVGFDACLMATVETASMLSRYADYLIASEETEPGIGWYYTDWLSALSADPSMATLDVGQLIVDDFVSTCAKQCAGQNTTLSVVDLAELGQTLSDDLTAFSQDLKERITEGDYKEVSTARSGCREFATSSVIDQIDFVDFAQRLGSDEGKALSQVLLSAVKYNRTSSNMTNAYGLSVYFPLRKVSSVNTAVQTYNALGMDEDFTDCIREFASLELSGQVSAAGNGYGGSPYSALFGNLSGAGGSGGSQSSADIADLLSLFLSGGGSGGLDLGSLAGLDTGFFSGRALENLDSTASYVAANSFDASALLWQLGEDGLYRLSLSEEQWGLVQNAELNLFYDDGEGYVDMGLDTLFYLDENGSLVPDTEGTWLSINDQPVAYYHLSTVDDGSHYSIMGRVPALLDGQRVNLILIFTDEQPDGFLAGAQPAYEADETETVARGLIELEPGQTLQFLCDFYSYEGEYRDSYYLGDPMTVTADMRVHDTYLGEGGTLILYRFTDIYDRHYWTAPLRAA